MKVRAKIKTYALVGKSVAGETADALTLIPNLMYSSDGRPIIAHTEEALAAYLQGEGGESLAVVLIGEADITFELDTDKIKQALGL
jgi:hypothetical protein